MNVITRGIRNAFRNMIRTFSIVVILGLSIGLALTMLIARQAVQTKIASVKSSIGNEITVSPAGSRGFEGGGNPLTDAQMTKVKSTPHVVSVTETLSDRLDSTQTNLQSSITPGTLGKRFGGSSGGGGGSAGGGGAGGGGFGGSSTGSSGTFTLPVSIIGTNSVSAAALGGGGTLKITSGKAFDPNSSADVALVGTSLASKNNLKTGSTFQAYGATITVAGIFDAGNEFSNSELLIPLPAEQQLSAQTGDVTSATVQVDSITNVASTVTALQNTLGSSNADVVSEQDTATNALAPLQNIATISLVSLIGAVIAGSVIILLTMLMIVRERRREIGVLKAIGASNIKVMLQFMTEAITFTLISAIVGLGIGAIGGNPVTQLLVTTSSSTTAGGGPGGGGGRGGGFGGGVSRVAGFGARGIHNITATVGWDILLYGLAAALVIAILGSAIPSLLIAKIRPAEVMRTE
ncbi:MAG TPA: FtsX-like permease family protein [Candidatus Saccharimonadales bacterium]|nr:FtsX-like permease family protein [Candidatus Saccharimonadales bacterium]